MAHNINTYIGRRSAWHNLGIVTGKHMSWTEMNETTDGLNFQVDKRQLSWNGNLIDAFGTFRMDNDEFLAYVTDSYEVIQHTQGFEIADQLIASLDGAHYETAGVLGKGEVVWGLADLALSMHVGDDLLKSYLLFCTSHDRSRSKSFRLVTERVVCQNTLDIAMREKTKNILTVRHNSKAQQKIADIQAALVNLNEDMATTEQKLQFLAGRKVTKESLTTIMDRLFPAKKDADGNDLEISTRKANTLADILRIYEENDGKNGFEEQRGTAYNLLNAVTNYTDHGRSTHNGDKGRAESAMFGSGNDLKNRAFEIIMESAGGMPVMRQRTILTSVPALQPVAGSPSPLLDAVLSNY